MADLVITATQVLVASLNGVKRDNAGEVIAAGQTVFKDPSDGLLYLSDNDDTDLARCDGIALNGALVAGQPVAYVASGKLVVGADATIAHGKVYVLSNTAGGIMPVDDLAATDMRVIILGVGKDDDDDSDTLVLSIMDFGVVIPTP